MAQPDRQVLPSKCSQCDRPMSHPVVCDFCHALNAASGPTDHFTLLQLPRTFALDADELHRKFVALSRHAHPDFHTDDAPEVQALSMGVSAAINDAYRTLKDPARRAAYLLELLGGRSAVDDKSVPDGFLETTMMLQEEIADGLAAGRTDELDRLRDVLQTQRGGLIRRVAGLFDEHQQAVSCEAVRSDLLGEIRRQLNAVSYVTKLLSQIP
jgi:molecular chaperone HscB